MAKQELTPEQQAEKKAAAAAKRKATIEAKKAAAAAGENTQDPGSTPEPPAEPVIPEAPASPEEPAAPDPGDTPESPAEPAKPEAPAAPEEPAAPEPGDTPDPPGEPAKPEAPAAPEEPAPVSPAASFSQDPDELAGRQEQTAAAKEQSNAADLAGAMAAIADPDSKEGKLLAKGREILSRHPAEPFVWMTADGLGFFRENDAHNHAADKKDRTVLTVTRE